MENQQILARVDHTILKAVSSWAEVEALCQEAVRYHTASVCIPPAYVKEASTAFPTLNVCTVIGFPLGYCTTAVKVFEAEDAIRNGASEIDMVINLGDVKNGRWERVSEEIRALRKATAGKILKVIIETCYLTEEEKIHLCRIVTEEQADFIKTSTGFGTGGATMADVLLMKANVGENVRIKASGGIRTREDMEAYCEAGCSRIGCSAAVSVLTK